MARALSDFRGNAIYLDATALVGLMDADSAYHPACAVSFR
jgi:hypothetical protein